MIRRVTLWHASGDPTEALRHWRNEHAKLVRMVPGVTRYVQSSCLADPADGPSGGTGLGEVWFDDPDAVRTAMSTPEWTAVIKDARTFMDFDRLLTVWAEAPETT